ncbi:MAG TPA: phosphatidate cytidylyltransferase [Candidatus Cloacimonadota bacterium]|nr:phosphatidate cytidylyltransferase [Candidatus Cloacimonadota bacterium]HPS38778.1 phosphatidate cytidylyltransferase [Candidatus Cloacimonadota bacterium]
MPFSAMSETIRKSIHISSLIIPLTYKYIITFERQKLAFFLLLIALIISLAIEFGRFWQKSFRKNFMRLFGLILRKHEWKDFTGATYLIFSSMLCVAFFRPDVAFCAMAFVSIGDTFAAMIGINFGKRKFLGMNKSLEGSIACFCSTFIFALIFGLHPIVAVVGALAAALAEVWNIPVDDNVKIPLISGIAMTFMGIII